MKTATAPSPLTQDQPPGQTQSPKANTSSHEQDYDRPTCKTSMLSKVAVCLAIAALLADVIGFGSPYWLTTRIFVPGYGSNDLSVGLFFGCTTQSGCASGGDPKTWQVAGAVVELIGFLIGFLTTILLILYVFIFPAKPWVKKLKYVAMTTSIIAGVFIFSGKILFAVNVNNVNDKLAGLAFDIGWSFAMCAVGGALFIIVAIVLIIDTLS